MKRKKSVRERMRKIKKIEDRKYKTKHEKR